MNTLRLSVVSILIFLPQVLFGQVLPTTGLKFLDDSSYQSIPLAATPIKRNLPRKADLSDRFPVPGYQGAQASCVGWATAYALKSFQEYDERKWPLTNRSHLFSPSYIYNQIKPSLDCKGYTTFPDALNLLKQEGVASLENFPYQENECSQQPNVSVKQSAKPFIIANWRRIDKHDVEEVKTQIASGFPVLIGMMVDQGFAQLHGSTIYSSPSGNEIGGHAMVVTGYDDARGAFKVINSWGTQWGENGFGWIAYSIFRQREPELVREAYVVQDIIARPPRDPIVKSPILDDSVVKSPLPILSPSPSAVIGSISHLQNVPVPSPSGPVPGMRITVPVSFLNAKGRTAQVVIKFNNLNGPPLFASPLETTFRDVGGLVATGSPARVVGSDNESFSDQQITIPYYALNFQPTNGQATYNLVFFALVYIDNQLVAQSAPVPFQLRY